MVTNQQKDQVWKAYLARKPIRVPVTYGVNPRMVLLDPKWNTKGITFREYVNSASAAIEIQLLFMEYKAEFLHQYCDQPLGRPKQLEFYVDKQNTFDAQYFGAPLEFREGQIGDVRPCLAGADKHRIFRIDIDRPLANPFVRDCLRRYEDLTAAVGRLSYHGMEFSVAPPLMNFDGPLTIAVNLRGAELLTDLYEDRPYALRLMDFIQRGVVIRNRTLARLFGKKAFDGPSGSYADDSIQLISTQMYRELVLPLHRAWYAQWSVDGPHYIHLCGDVARHLPIIREQLHVNSFDTGFPLDHGAVRAALGEDVEIFGGPEVGVLLNGTSEQVQERTRQILTSGVMGGGRFVLREANNLAPCTPGENLAAMYRSCLAHGNYDT